MRRSHRSQPLRYQIRKDLLDFILDQGYQPGDQLPSEQELIDHLGVSRFSLREALHLLEEERVIATKHGSGRYLTSLPSDIHIDISELQSVTELLSRLGIRAVNKLLRVAEKPGDAEVCENLEIEKGTPVIAIERMRYAGDKPIIYSVDYLAASMLPDDWSEEDLKGSLFNFLETRSGIRLDRSQATVRASFLRNETDQIINDPYTPWILMEQIIYDQEGKPVIYSKDYHHSDHITFHIRRFRR